MHLSARDRAAVVAYHATERRVARVSASVVVLLVVLNAVPGSVRGTSPQPAIRPSPLLAGTSLAGTELGGVLEPLVAAAADTVRTYLTETDEYYDRLRASLRHALANGAPALPSGPDVAHLLFVTDRHCNIGMDRVIVALAEHYRITVLVSGGDDDFSGSFAFESACTANLAAKSQQAGMQDVFVAGNHDSAATLTNEKEQGIHVLDGSLVTIDGITFAGYPDPRSSRYGQGLRPASAQLQNELITAVGRRTGRLACRGTGPVIAVLHDPVSGRLALRNGCGKVVLALDGHTHFQNGPSTVRLPNGATGYQFTGGSAGGASNDAMLGRTFLAQLTVGPLNHPAVLNIASVDRHTGGLLGITAVRLDPSGEVSFEPLTP